MMGNSLAKVLTRAALRREARAKSYRRGEAYFDDGAVRGIVEDKGVLTAKVAGTRNYTVRLWADGDRLGYSCSCPLGVDGVRKPARPTSAGATSLKCSTARSGSPLSLRGLQHARIQALP